MRPRFPLPLVLLAALLGGACAPAPEPGTAEATMASFLGNEAGPWVEAGAEAEMAYARGDWARAEAAWEKRIGLYDSGSGGESGKRPATADLLVAQDLYNLACVRALAGRSEAALDALEGAVGDGCGVVDFDHLLGDPDLHSLRGEPRWEALLRRLTWNEEVVVLGAGGPGGAHPLVVRLEAGGAGGTGVPGAVTAVPTAPYRVGPAEFSWTTRLDRGEKAAEKVAFAVEAAGRAHGLAEGRRVLVASGREMTAIAWEVLLRRPDLFTVAVMDGPAPPAWALLDRGAEKVRARILVVGESGVPDAAVPVRAERVASLEAGLAEALR